METSCSKTNDIKDIIKILKSISDENRFKIICFLRKNWSQCVCDITDFLQLPQNLVSHHLKKLKEAWLVSFKKKWLKISYTLNKEKIQILNKFLYTLS